MIEICLDQLLYPDFDQKLLKELRSGVNWKIEEVLQRELMNLLYDRLFLQFRSEIDSHLRTYINYLVIL